MKLILMFKNMFLKFLIVYFSLSMLYLRTEGNVIFYDEDEDITDIPLSTSVTVTALPGTISQKDEASVTKESTIKTTTEDEDDYIDNPTEIIKTTTEDEDEDDYIDDPAEINTSKEPTTEEEDEDDYIDDPAEINTSKEPTAKDGREEADGTENSRSMEEATTDEPPPVPANSDLEMMKYYIQHLDDENDRNVIIASTVAGCGFFLIICALLYLAFALALLKHSEKGNISDV